MALSHSSPSPSTCFALLVACTCLVASAMAAQPAHRKLLGANSIPSTDGIISNIDDYFNWDDSSSSSGGSLPSGPCIECKDCKTNHCYSVCQKSCQSQPTVDGNACKAYGRQAGDSAASSACQSAKLYCNGGQKPIGSFGAFPVSLTQCQNIAYGVCQQQAGSAWTSPCGVYMTFGYSKCTAQQFVQFYTGEVNSFCQQKVQQIAP